MQAEVTCDDYRTWRGDYRLPELRTSRLPRIFPHLNSLNSVQSCAKHELLKKKAKNNESDKRGEENVTNDETSNNRQDDENQP